MKKYILILIMCMVSLCGHAQNDPVLAGLIVDCTSKAKKSLQKQEEMMLLQTTGHIWTKAEVSGTTDLQKEFNNYLSSFRSVIVYAAQIYGFYYEIDHLVTNLNDFTHVLQGHESNALAVALSSKRNKIYQDLVMNSIDIVNDIRTACFSGHKMTERERLEIVLNIRPKLKKMNKQVQHLTRAVKYSTMTDVWYEIDERARPAPANKAEIAEAARRQWRKLGRTVKP